MITALRDLRISENQRRIIATSDLDAPVFRFYVEGRLFATQSLNFIDVLTNGAPVPVDVFDQDEPLAVPAPSAVVGMRIYWEPAPGFASFRVEHFVSSQWVDKGSISALPLRRGYDFTVTGLADQTRHRLRVMGIADDGTEAEVIVRAAFLIRNPDVPRQTYTATGGTLSVGAA
jgi:hypothetical protein